VGNRAVSLLIAAVLVYLALFAFAQFMKRTSMFFPDRYPAGNWNTTTWPIRPEEHYFATPDGVRLHGWCFRARGRAPAPLLVYFHGNAGNVTLRAPAAIELAMQGIDVFVFDYRGFGRSEGHASESVLRVDSLAAYDYAISRFKGYEGRVALYGESIGGAYAAWVASQRDVRCVVVESSFPSLAAEVNAIYRPLPMGIFVPLSLPVLRWLDAAGRPVLVAHGRRDEVVPFEVGMRLYDRLRVPKEVFVSETAGHCEVPAVEGRRYAEAVARFIEASGASTRLE
jgi:fermentation-respiration switch protein FrsA (DUF1100 family)